MKTMMIEKLLAISKKFFTSPKPVRHHFVRFHFIHFWNFHIFHFHIQIFHFNILHFPLPKASLAPYCQMSLHSLLHLPLSLFNFHVFHSYFHISYSHFHIFNSDIVPNFHHQVFTIWNQSKSLSIRLCHISLLSSNSVLWSFNTWTLGFD